VSGVERTWSVGQIFFSVHGFRQPSDCDSHRGKGVGTIALLLTLCLVPPAILLLVWRGAPPPTVGELLYVVNGPKDGRS